MKKIFSLIFALFLLFTTFSLVSSADSNGWLQIWRNATTQNNVSWVDYNGNWFMQGNLNLTGTLYGSFNGTWNGSGNYVPYIGSNQNVSLGDYNFSVGGSDFFVNANTGKVGIGTTSPQRTLEVSSNAVPYIRVTAASADANAYLELYSRYSGVAKYVQFWSDGLGNLQVNPQGGIIYLGGNTLVNNAGNSYFNGGNVGIGTTSPQNKLNVVGDINATGSIYSQGINLTAITSSGYVTSSQLAGNITNFYLNTSNQFGYYNSTTLPSTQSLTDLWVSSNLTIGKNLSVSGNALFVNNNTGYVGIGTTSPSVKLEVNGYIRNLNSDIDINTDGYGLSFGSGDAKIVETSYKLGFLTWTGSALTEKMSILGNGNIGIGTTSPVDKLHLEDTNTGATIYQRFTNDGTGSTATDGLRIGLNSIEEPLFWNFENTNMKFATNNALRMVIDNTGKVGIGTTTPQNKLNVVGDGNFTGSIYSQGINLTAITSSGYVTSSQLAGNITNFYLNTSNQFSYINTTNFPNLNNIYLNTSNQFGYYNSTTLPSTQ